MRSELKSYTIELEIEKKICSSHLHSQLCGSADFLLMCSEFLFSSLLLIVYVLILAGSKRAALITLIRRDYPLF